MASLEAGRGLAGRYVLKERLGDGGHAEVWAAQDASSGQLVALKFMHLRACSVEEALPVLRHEARMARFLDHPGVLRVEEPLRDGDTVFLPMEYAPGGSAAQLRGTSWRRIVPVLVEVARVLEHAHARGIVHRDIKPGNVLFAADGSVRLADFGTSTETGSSDAPANGSPFSASPQQLRGEAASPADDVYGLGALAHELLTRYPPFYPHFDARRVQEQDPPRPVPARPAPVALLDLVQAFFAAGAAGGDRNTRSHARFRGGARGRRRDDCRSRTGREEGHRGRRAWRTDVVVGPGGGRSRRPCRGVVAAEARRRSGTGGARRSGCGAQCGRCTDPG
jgi:hypothetical protein